MLATGRTGARSSGGRQVIIGVPREVAAGERRVAVVPVSVRRLLEAGLEVRIETGAGSESQNG
ncbi:MAG: hypothetical protein IH800_09200, partial [Myxococcales bacterium]|nr:hypothetical protein [Myxococcales bacterium]